MRAPLKMKTRKSSKIKYTLEDKVYSILFLLATAGMIAMSIYMITLYIQYKDSFFLTSMIISIILAILFCTQIKSAFRVFYSK